MSLISHEGVDVLLLVAVRIHTYMDLRGGRKPMTTSSLELQRLHTTTQRE